MIRPCPLLIVCNDYLHGQCLAEAVSAKASLSPVTLLRDTVEAFQHIQADSPEVVLLDWHLPYGSGLDLIRWSTTHCPQVKFLFFGLTGAAEANLVHEQAPGAEIILRSESLDDLIGRLGRLLRRESLDGDGKVPDPTTPHAGRPRPQVVYARPGPKGLTLREQQIVHLIGHGLSNKEIASRFNLSLHTVKNHIHNLLAKLDVESRHEAVRICSLRYPTGQ